MMPYLEEGDIGAVVSVWSIPSLWTNHFTVGLCSLYTFKSYSGPPVLNPWELGHPWKLYCGAWAAKQSRLRGSDTPESLLGVSGSFGALRWYGKIGWRGSREITYQQMTIPMTFQCLPIFSHLLALYGPDGLVTRHRSSQTSLTWALITFQAQDLQLP